jgi:hypothetical protein
MDEVKFIGRGTAKIAAADGRMIAFLVVDGDVMLHTGTTQRDIPNLSGFVLKAGHTASWRMDCKSPSGCTVLELKMGDFFSTSYMHDAAYGVPWNTYVTDTTSSYVKAAWGPAKNTYQKCTADNDASLAPYFQIFTDDNKPTGDQNRTSVFSCYMSCVSKNFGNPQQTVACGDLYPKQQIVPTSSACPELYSAPHD